MYDPSKPPDADRLADIYRALARSLPQQSVIVFDHQLRILVADGDEMLRLIGVDGRAALGRNIEDLSSPRNAAALSRHYRDALAGIEHHMEAVRNGRTLSIRTCPVRDEAGALVAAMVVSTDITARVETENEVRRQAQVVERQRQLLENALDGIGLLDVNERFVQVNAEYAAQAGYTAPELLGRSWRDLVAPEDIAAGEAMIAETRERGRAERRLKGVRKDGGNFFKQVRTIATRDDSGAYAGYGAFTRDVTEAHRAFDEAVNARKVAEQAVAARSEFLARMSHEIRTPMNGVMGMTALVLDSELTPTQREHLLTVQSSAAGLLQIINDVLDFSKIDAGRLEIEAVPFGLRQHLHTLLGPLRAVASGRGIGLHLRVADDVADERIGDPTRLGQILTNLCSNACKFTFHGDVEVAVSSEPAPEGTDGIEPWVQIRVTDSGIGIPRDQQQEIFSPFTQVDSATARRFGGTGLGLAICAQLVSLMRGRIELTSEPSKGSCFAVHLPLRRAPSDRAVVGGPAGVPPSWAPRPGVTRRPLHVLVAEDNRVNRLLAQGLLGRAGHRTTLVENGAEAVAAVAGGHFDIVLMDVQMPQMDGLDATRAIRAAEAGAGRHVPIVALTAQAMVGDAELCLAAGMDGYLSKPFGAAELLSTLDRFAQPPAASAAQASKV